MNNTCPQPVIILCAARSGSKLLRDVLASSKQIEVVPYDINYIWKYSNNHLFHDELNKTDLNEKITKYIRDYILKFASKKQDQYILEKTVSNSLRVEFVKSVFPEAKLIHLYRDGRDVALSALGCWTSDVLDSKNQPLKTYVKKIIEFPYFTASDYLLARCKEIAAQKFSTKSHYYWGPRFKGVKELVATQSLAEVCAHQWVSSVERTLNELQTLQLNCDYVTVKYEDFVQKPEAEIHKLCEYIGVNDAKSVVQFAKNTVRTNSIGRWANQLESYENELLPIMRSTLVSLGYIQDTEEQC